MLTLKWVGHKKCHWGIIVFISPYRRWKGRRIFGKNKGISMTTSLRKYVCFGFSITFLWKFLLLLYFCLTFTYVNSWCFCILSIKITNTGRVALFLFYAKGWTIRIKKHYFSERIEIDWYEIVSLITLIEMNEQKVLGEMPSTRSKAPEATNVIIRPCGKTWAWKDIF